MASQTEFFGLSFIICPQRAALIIMVKNFLISTKCLEKNWNAYVECNNRLFLTVISYLKDLVMSFWQCGSLETLSGFTITTLCYFRKFYEVKNPKFVLVSSFIFHSPHRKYSVYSRREKIFLRDCSKAI